MITADGGGSNGYRLRARKTHLAALAAETGLRITVCHYPPGTSKWNRIEHRMFSFITINWRGVPSKRCGPSSRLFVSPKTVEGYVRSIFMKLDLPPGERDHRRVLAVLRFLRQQ